MKNKRLKEIEERLAEIKGIVDSDENVENIDALNTEADQLLAERNKILENIQNYQQLRQKIADGSIGTSVNIGGNTDAENFEERAKKFASTKRTSIATTQLRAALVSSGKLATPTAVSGINDTVGAKHSSIIDLVKIVDCGGMGSNKVAYIDTDADAAAEHTEGSAATAKEATFGYVEITPKTLATYAQISEQAKNQTPLQYEAKVQEQALISLRKAAVKLVISKLKASALNKAVDASVSSAKKGILDENTLTDFLLEYGGDESVVGEAVLFLNKKDLRAIGKIRGTQDKKKVYEIVPDGSNPNVGIIKDGGLAIKYCICSELAACVDTAQGSAAIPTMFYGNPQCLELDLFTDYQVKVSEEFAFTSLMDTILGSVSLGADVVAKNGFVSLTIPASA
jgi:HK97 family phage major capsid protein|nr:MAG TPA: major capsid protein [Caudoviricetes sp.]